MVEVQSKLHHTTCCGKGQAAMTVEILEQAKVEVVL